MSHDSLRSLRHFVLDLDGTLYRGNHLFTSTLPLLECLHRRDIRFTFLTNNTSQSKKDYVEKLRGFNIPSVESQIYTPADSAIEYLRRQLPDAGRIAILGTPSLCRQFEQAGFIVSWDEPEAVIVGFDTTLAYERLCRAAYWITQGRPYIATHPDLVCPTDEPTVLIDCGAICASLSAATGQKPIVLGKPDPQILLDICEAHRLKPAQVAMVGDRIYTDMVMAQRAGAFSILVLSGEATADDAAKMQQPPNLIVDDVGELLERLEANFTS